MGKVKFDEIAKECRDTYRGSLINVPIVGLEHIEPHDMLLRNYDVNVETTFTKSFKNGQILFGRRRAYQQKACVATCDGICSGDITVIEPKGKLIYPGLLPWVVQNDSFFDHAVRGSNGALSPRVKWEHMASFELNLPSIDDQKSLADKLWAAYELKQSYIKMIAATDEMVKSRFIEMFGNRPKDTPIKKVCTVVSGKSIPTALEDIVGTIPYVKVGDFNMEANEKFITTSPRLVKAENAKLSKMIPIGSVIFAKNGAASMLNKKRLTKVECCIDMNTMGIVPDKSLIIPEFLLSVMEAMNTSALVRQGAVPSISPKAIEDTLIFLPTLREQSAYIAIAEQADKSKSEERNEFFSRI